jgi:hypothetical protein
MMPTAASPFAAEAAPDIRREPVVLRPVASREDWAAVRALRFAALSRCGDIPACPLPTYGDAYDAAPGARTYMLAEGGRAIGSTRCMHSQGEGGARLPALEAFRGELDAAIAAAPIVEASLTLLDAPMDRALAHLRLFRVHMTACAALEAEWLLAAVRETEMGFYRRVFGMEILTGAARWAGLAMPRVLMGLPFRERAPALCRRLPILAPGATDVQRFRAGEALELGEAACGAAWG